MNEAKLKTVAQVKAFLAGTQGIELRLPKKERYGFVERVLKGMGYAPLSRPDKGVVLRYLEQMTEMSRQEVTRLARGIGTKGHGACIIRC